MLLVFLLLDAYAESISKRFSEVLKIFLTWTLTEFKRLFSFFPPSNFQYPQVKYTQKFNLKVKGFSFLPVLQIQPDVRVTSNLNQDNLNSVVLEDFIVVLVYLQRHLYNLIVLLAW